MRQEDFAIHVGWLVAIMAASGALLSILLSLRIAFYARERRAEAARRAEAEALRAAAENASRTKDLFLAALSHELRGPLGAVIGWIDVARGYLDNPRELERCLDIVLRNAKQEARIIDDLLDVSSILSGKFAVDLAPVPLAGVVQDGVEACRPVADEKGVALRASIDASLSVSGDRKRLLQVLHNLIGNAIKFSAPGGWVRVTLERAEPCARIVVADNGAGIGKEALKHVFERFWQSERRPGAGYAGLGLGLAIVHHIVALHGGRIAAESRGPGLGATFTVELPLIAGRTAESGDDASAAVHGEPSLAGFAVVAVEDDRDTRDWLERVLRRHGAQVWCASSADEAEALCARVSPDLLVSDIAMPRRDGCDLVRALRAQPDRRPFGALALSAQASQEDREHALEAGYDAFQPKPCEGGTLVRALQRLARARARAEAP